MSNTTKPRRSRRRFDDEFKAGAARLVLDEGQTVGRVARDLDLTESSLRNWVEQARADRTKGKTGLTTEERTELAALRKDNRELRMERDILKNCPTGGTVSCRDRNSRTAYAAKQPRGAAVCFLVALTPLKNLAHGRLRTCEW